MILIILNSLINLLMKNHIANNLYLINLFVANPFIVVYTYNKCAYNFGYNLARVFETHEP